MQFPNTMQTARTEAFMAEWRKQNPGADTSTYNRKFSETYERFGSDTDARSPGPVNRYEEMEASVRQQEEEARRRNTADAEAIMRAKDLAIRRETGRSKHRPQTKGAFGKPKRR